MKKLLEKSRQFLTLFESKPENLKLEEGELICDKCNGKGCLPSKIDPTTMASVCQKCQGRGKVDWIENIVGKKPDVILSGSSSIFTSTSGFGKMLKTYNDAVDAMSYALAASIDKEILDSIKNHSEQTLEIKKTASKVLNEMEGIFDNRIIS